MITLTRTELQWIEMWLRELESIHKQGDGASHPLVKLNLSNSEQTRKKLQMILESGQKRIDVK